MSGLNERHMNCPSEEELVAYKNRELTGDEYEAVSLHLLMCDACLGYLDLLPDSAQSDQEPEPEAETERFQVEMTPSLSESIERFLARQANLEELPEKTWPQVQAEGGLKLGQIWRTKTEGIVLPRREGNELLTVTQLDSAPHLVVITGVNAGAGEVAGEPYHIIRVAPVSAEVNYAGGDPVIPETESPLHFALMIQLFNEQLMLRENLAAWVGEFTEARHHALLSLLKEQSQCELNEGAFSLETIILKGLYTDPVMRYRAKEYEDTKYLRVPVEVLLESIAAEEMEVTEVEDVLAAATPSASRANVREWLNSARDWLRFKLEGAGEPLLMQAQEKSKSGWPVEAQMEIEVAGESLPIKLEFNWRGSSLIVEERSSKDIGRIVLPFEKLDRAIQLRHNARAIVGPLQEFNLTAKSNKQEIIAALVAAGISKPYLGDTHEHST